TSGGHNVAPEGIEVALKSDRLVAHACLVGEARPYLTALLVLDGEEAPTWAESQGLPYEDLASFSALPRVKTEIDRLVDEVNSNLARAEQVKKWVIVEHEWGPETGEITPSLKVKRTVVLQKYQEAIDALYRE
ncbi:MAG: long-chain fatty acid--CoA ligase, partial [Acidimicrobiia bacterium]